MPDEPIPEGTRPLLVYRHEGDCIKVLLPGQPPITMWPGDTLNLRYSVAWNADHRPVLRYEAVDG